MENIIADVGDKLYSELERLRVSYKAKNWASLLEILVLRRKGMEVR